MGEIIIRTNKEVLQYFDEMKKASTLVDFIKSNYTPSLNGERYMTDTELAEMLKLSKRTLLEYRNSGKIPYYQIGGKILYRESDIERLLAENHKDAFR
ncbi:helix-turn-helix domain-containing protein [Bacteroides nordii]|uniref:helix-turn-helix domain-containing protein n=1 Tax=Bacteroides nordii TaxID=291645 RepID=UPI0018979526|nr:helix-turn-helix domain-containing protein [Bacteroides nordii]